MSFTIKFKRGTASEWNNSASPSGVVLALGEPGYEKDTGKLKIGNGNTPWGLLPYVGLEPNDEYIQDLLASFIQNGSGIGVVHDDGLNTLTINVTGLNSSYISDFNEAVDDRVGSGLFISSTGILLSYNDIGNSFTISTTGVSLSGHSHNSSDITNFASSVSGLLPSVSGSGYVNSSFNNNLYTISVTGLQPSGNYSPLFDQSLNTTDDVEFNDITINNKLYFKEGQYIETTNGANLKGQYIFKLQDGTNILELEDYIKLYYYLKFADNTTQTTAWSGTINTSQINNFGVSVSGLLPTITNSGDNRLLTSTGTTTGINGESNLTFNGSLLSVSGNILAQEIHLYNGSSTILTGTNTEERNISFPDSDGTVVLYDASNITNLPGDLNVTGSGIFSDLTVNTSGNVNLQNVLTIDSDNFLTIYGQNSALLDTEDNSIYKWGLLDCTIQNSVIGDVVPSSGYFTNLFVNNSGVPVGSGAANHVAYWSSNSALTHGSGQLYWDATNNRLGIGTASPAYILDVAGTGNFSQNLLVNGTGVSISGHTHTSSDITNFNSSVSGLLPTIANSGDNRILTSTGTSTGINAESNLTFNGTSLVVTGDATVDNLKLDGNTLSSTNSNGNIIIQPSGTGALQRDGGGNARGQYAVDWQTVRASGSQVASGNYSVIGGGRNNTVSTDDSTIGGGRGNSVSGSGSSYCAIGGGGSNSVSGNGSSYCAIGGGASNRVSGTSSPLSTIGGGYNNSVSGTYSTFSTIGGGNSNSVTGDNSDGCAIGGGASNSVSGSYSGGCAIGGGSGNSVTGDNSNGCAIGGGINNTVSGNYSGGCAIGGGSGNTVSGSYSESSVIGGGANNVIGDNAVSSIIPGGAFAKTTRYSELSHAAGRFDNNGDAQHSIFILRNKTSGSPAGPTELALNGSSIYLTISSGEILSGTANIVGSKSDGSAVARYYRQFTIKNVAGTTTLVGSVISLGTDEASGTDITITADDTNDRLAIKASGVNNETWRWVAVVDTVKMMYGL